MFKSRGEKIVTINIVFSCVENNVIHTSLLCDFIKLINPIWNICEITEGFFEENLFISDKYCAFLNACVLFYHMAICEYDNHAALLTFMMDNYQEIRIWNF